MTSQLYCGENGCTLHDYKVSPAFCEYEWHKVRKRREEEDRQKSLEKLIKTVIQEVIDSKDVSSPKTANTSSEPSRIDKYKGGGLSI